MVYQTDKGKYWKFPVIYDCWLQILHANIKEGKLKKSKIKGTISYRVVILERETAREVIRSIKIMFLSYLQKLKIVQICVHNYRHINTHRHMHTQTHSHVCYVTLTKNVPTKAHRLSTIAPKLGIKNEHSVLFFLLLWYFSRDSQNNVGYCPQKYSRVLKSWPIAGDVMHLRYRTRIIQHGFDLNITFIIMIFYNPGSFYSGLYWKQPTGLQSCNSILVWNILCWIMHMSTKFSDSTYDPVLRNLVSIGRVLSADSGITLDQQ